MVNIRHNFTHDVLSPIEWGELISAVEWLMETCPLYSDGPGSRFPGTQLRGDLITASFANNANGQLVPLRKNLIDHDNPKVVQAVRGTPHIVFNGSDTTGEVFLMIGSQATTETQSVRTGGKPYDLLVCATLILANHLAPDSWEISSTGTEAAWNDALQLARGFNSAITLPEGVACGFDTGPQGRAPEPVSVPAAMDFRG